jgi:hypothetical protein
VHGGHLADAGLILDGEIPSGGLAYGAWAGDVDGDGREDLLLGAPAYSDVAGTAYLVRGGTSGRVDVGDAAAVTWTAPSTGSGRGMQLAGGGDLTGDGLPDVVLADPWDSTIAHDGGGIYVLSAPFDGGDLSAASARLYGGTAEQLGWALAGPVDYDGDGQDDLVALDRGRLDGNGEHGAVIVVEGPVSGSTTSVTADTTWEFEPGSGTMGSDEALHAVGDVDGDGIDDVTLCSWYGPNSTGGVCWLMAGGASGTTNLALADARIQGASNQDDLNYAGTAGDLDGDGKADLLVGNPADTTDGAGSGAVFVFYGSVRGSHGLDDADVRFVAPSASFSAGFGMAGGDVTGDGLPDLLLSGATANGDEAGSGAVFVFPGG